MSGGDKRQTEEHTRQLLDIGEIEFDDAGVPNMGKILLLAGASSSELTICVTYSRDSRRGIW